MRRGICTIARCDLLPYYRSGNPDEDGQVRLIDRKVDGIPIFLFESAPNNGQFNHAVYTRQGGTSPAPYNTLNLSVSVADDEQNVLRNRSRAYGALERTNETLVHAHLCHGADVAVVSHENYGEYVGPVDGLVTDEPGCGLTMNYADCAPILLLDPVQHAIGLGHAGWKGAIKDLPGALVRKMQQQFNSDPVDLIAAIGPAIGPCCYQVGEPVISAVYAAFDTPEKLLVHPEDKHAGTLDTSRPNLDLPEANRIRLTQAGVVNIEISGLCTACRTDLFFSYRAEKGRTGRFGTILILSQ